MNVKLLLVEDHDIVRQGIHSLLENEPDIKIIAEAKNGMEALELCRKDSPDLVLMDMNMPVMNGSDCARAIGKEFPDVKVVILSMHDYEHYLIDMLEAGAKGYILKNSSKDELLFAIRKIAKGGVYIGPEFTLAMLDKYKNGIGMASESPLIVLTEGESEILRLVAEGFTNLEMANKLFISVRTVESRRKKLLEKTGTSNTATLIKYALKHGLIK
jgi:DNA-binding NarL/FixJ family response regulator